MPVLDTIQQEGVDWILQQLRTHKGVILGDEMGLGKTAQGIEVLKRAKKDKPSIIICPAYLIPNWLDELEMWEYTGHVQRIETSKTLVEKADLYIGSYAIMTSETIHKQLLKQSYNVLLCDEGHYLKTWNSIRSRRILGTFKNKKSNLKVKSSRIILLTGTPIINRVEEIYNLVIRLAPEILNHMSKQEFIFFFAAWWEFTPFGLKHGGVKNEKELLALLKNVLLIRKNTTLDAAIHKNIRVELKGEKLKKFIREEEKFLADHDIKENDIIEFTGKTKFDASEISEIRQQLALYKIPVMMKALDDIIEKHGPVCIYCYHRMIQTEIQKQAIKKYPSKRIEIVNGSVSKEKRHEIVKSFQAGEVDIILATIGAMREGVNLTAGHAVVFLELDWTPANIDQAIARFRRRGQIKQVFCYFFYFKEGIDGHIIKLLKAKQKMIKKITG